MQQATPMLSYEDVAAAIDWLAEAFGFQESGERYTDPDGRVTQAELDLAGAKVMVGWPGPDYRGPARHAAECEHARRWLATPWVIDGVHVTVDDVTRTTNGLVRRGRRSSVSWRIFRSAGSTARPMSKATAGCSCALRPESGPR